MPHPVVRTYRTYHTYEYEARKITGDQRLRTTHVIANTTVPIGFIGLTTDFRAHRFEGEVVVGKLTQDGHCWNTLQLISGVTLGVWTDPYGHKHSFLLNVSPPPQANDRLITERFAQLQLAWRIMAETDTPYYLVEQTIRSAGPKHALDAIRLAKWLSSPVQPPRPTAAELLRISKIDLFRQARAWLRETSFTELSDDQLTNVLLGAERYARVLTAL